MITSTDSNTQQSCAVGGDTKAKKNNEELEISCSATMGPTSVTPRSGDQRPPESSLQGKEGVLRPLGLLVGAGRGSSRVSLVRLRGRRDGVGDLCPFLKELIKLCQIHMSVVKCEMCFSHNGGETNGAAMGPYLHLSHLPLSRLLSET